jgi:hypothetical protein
MITPNLIVLKIIEWIADRLGFDLDLREERIVGPLDEEDIAD